MEHPDTWRALTASLAVCNRGDAHEAWAFIVHRGLVRNEPGDKEKFLRIRAELPLDETGPSFEARTAARLQLEGLALPAADEPDPMARIADEAYRKWKA